MGGEKVFLTTKRDSLTAAKFACQQSDFDLIGVDEQSRSNFVTILFCFLRFRLLETICFKKMKFLVCSVRGARYLTGENLDVVWAEFSALS